MNPQKLTSANYFIAIKAIHLALMGGILFFSLITFFLVSNGTASKAGADEDYMMFRWMVPMVVAAGIVASHFIFKQRISECIGQSSLPKKLECYRSALIVRYALIEGPAFFSIVAFLLTGKLFYLGLTGLLLVVFLIYRPTVEKAITDLELDHREREMVNDPEAVVN